jgi:hypothetical protein
MRMTATGTTAVTTDLGPVPLTVPGRLLEVITSFAAH